MSLKFLINFAEFQKDCCTATFYHYCVPKKNLHISLHSAVEPLGFVQLVQEVAGNTSGLDMLRAGDKS